MEVVVANTVVSQHQQPSPQPLLVAEPALDDQELKTPKKRAETWVQDEIKALIALRKEMDTLFNTSKSNKHLWEQISTKMKERGYERSATMCTDKWRNLLKEYKKAKHQDRGGSAKVACFKDLEELLGDRGKSQTPLKAPLPANKIDAPSPLLTPVSKVTTRSALNLERRLDHDGHPTAIPSSDAMVHGGLVPANGITPPQQPWNWRDPSSNGLHRSATNVGATNVGATNVGATNVGVTNVGPPEVILGLPHQGLAGGRHVETPSNWVNQTTAATPLNGGERRSVGALSGKVILIKCGEIARRIRIDGPFESIKESIKTTFGLRSRRGFWLEDEEGVVQTLSRDMPLGEYTLNLDPGVTVKIYVYDESDHLTGSTETKTFYTEEDFREFLKWRGWSGLREVNVGGFRDMDNLEELCAGAVYHRAGVLGA